ncbi:MAG TPA: hypothetical protein VJH90_01800, partial [archaeon]|nr:hypothetical protein [archaeon]
LTIQGFAGPFNLFVIGDITTGTSAQNKRYYAWDGGVKKRVLLEGEGGLTQDYRSYYFNVLGPATTKTYLPPGGYGEVRFTRYVDVNNVVGSENKATATCSVRLKANTTACSGGCKAIYVAVYAPDGSRLCYAGNPDYVNYPPTASTISAVSSTVGSAITTGKYQTFIMYQVPLGTSSIDGWALEDLGADLVLKTYT